MIGPCEVKRIFGSTGTAVSLARLDSGRHNKQLFLSQVLLALHYVWKT